MATATATNTPTPAPEPLKAPEPDREAIRRAIFESEESKVKPISFKFNGVDIEWRPPTISEAQSDESREAMEGRNFIIMMIISNSYIPNTDIKIFTIEDYDTISNMRMTGSFSKAVTKIAQALDLGVDEKLKNSEEAQLDSQ